MRCATSNDTRDQAAIVNGATEQRREACLTVDAGVEHVRVRQIGAGGRVTLDESVVNHGDLRHAFDRHGLLASAGSPERRRVVITGRLAATARRAIGTGRIVAPAAALWLAARHLIARPEHGATRRLALLDLSASGYLVVGVDRQGELVDDLLVVNPRCGAGSGINLDRVLQKLAIDRQEVDGLLSAFAGDTGREARARISTRADRCGVFASSATVSDKNQGIPLDVALATTLKSEVLKACRRVPHGFDAVHLSGRIFCWQFARDIAEDYLGAQGAGQLDWDAENTHVHDALRDVALADEQTCINVSASEQASIGQATGTLPGFASIHRLYSSDGRFLRLTGMPPVVNESGDIAHRDVFIGLDVGSTMAKAVVADAASGTMLRLSASSNAGDTIETVKRVWRDLSEDGLSTLRVRGIGITGSARHQVRETLARIYPALTSRLHVLVENFAHARGSLDEARRHLDRLAAQGIEVNRDFCVVVDIGGEDTKVSTIALGRGELYANAMNLKCSAGTGSLMDTLASLFGIRDVAAACAEAAAAPRAVAINATCAVFLMEHARRLQAEGVARNEILASANWAIVENMARTLWSQIEIPSRAVVLLHGQTMLSDPLPLSVTDRLQAFLGAPAYVLVPPHPGHRACFGLVKTMLAEAASGSAEVRIADLLEARFDRRIIECRGAACGDAAARCHRTSLSCRGADGGRFTFSLGGCTAINELFARRTRHAEPPPRDAYKEIWDHLAAALPRSDAPDRLVIPRSFCVTEWACLFARMFQRFAIPVHVDDVRESDLLEAQGAFHIDTCAPQMGAVGQYRRLASEPHGMILAPQIETLPAGGPGLAQTCTVNQGGPAVAANLAAVAYPNARLHQFAVRLQPFEAGPLSDQLRDRLGAVFAHYGIDPSPEALTEAIAGAIDDYRHWRRGAADLAADLAEAALAEGRQIALVVGREYVLNPGLYDSSVRRLLLDKRMTAIPSYVLDVELDQRFSYLYWRNPHAIVSILKAVADRRMHAIVRHPRLAAVFRAIEAADPPGALLPVVQVSTFSCGPDSVTAPLVAEIMRHRPFLLLQSDAVLKELAHLENRVNTYVKQLEMNLQRDLGVNETVSIEMLRLQDLGAAGPLGRERDIVYVPTIGDNRSLTAVLRAAGFTCVDNWDETVRLADIVGEGRRFTGDAVCAPLAAIYGDLLRAVEDFRARAAHGDPLVQGKRRLVYIDNQGDGPCRQGQYAEVHALLSRAIGRRTDRQPGASAGDGALPGLATFGILVAHERTGYDIGLEEWAVARVYQSVVVHAVMQDLLFAAGARCRDKEEYERMRADHCVLKQIVYSHLEAFSGPGVWGRRAVGLMGNWPGAGLAARYFGYRMNGHDLTPFLRRFSRQWIRHRSLDTGHLRVHVSGEVYIRVAQAEALFDRLVTLVGFRRFEMSLSPLWAYLEYLPEYQVEVSRERLAWIRSARRRKTAPSDTPHVDSTKRDARREIRHARTTRFILRHLLARPLYRAAGLPLPPPPRMLLEQARAVLPTLRPHGELGLYAGEAIDELRRGVDLFISLAPSGCMVTSMGEILKPALAMAAGSPSGRIQSLFTSNGDLDEETLALAILKVRATHERG